MSLTSRRTRGLGFFCLAGALAFTLLVSWNCTARYHNFRYYVPPLTLCLYASTLGVAAMCGTRMGHTASAAGAVAGIALAAGQVPEAARLFLRASRNIHEQQVEVGHRIAAATPREAIVLLGDAGAIPYVSQRRAVDVFGLGGYLGVPFVRAAVHGEGATLELIERLAPRDRPTIMALYPNWLPGVTGTFGHERDRVTITDNVICGGVTKGIYEPDWSALRGGDGDDAPAPGGVADEPSVRRVLDEIDVADVVSEEAHGYTSPAPHGGWTLWGIRDNGFGIRRFDAGRIIPQGQSESFFVRSAAGAGSELVVRTDDGTPQQPSSEAEVTVVWTRRAGADDEGRVVETAPLRPDARVADDATRSPRWRLSRAAVVVPILAGDRATVRVERGVLRDYHVWLTALATSPP